MSRSLGALADSQLVDGEVPDWRDQLLPASFRGVEFQVDTIEWTAGDHVVVREYPFQDLPAVFSMGKVAQELRFSAYVIGDDYHLKRDALMSALSGSGLLVHPTAGNLMVHVAGPYTVRENPTAEGGMARFDLRFVRADLERKYDRARTSTSDSATAAAETAKTAAVQQAAAKLKLKGLPDWVNLETLKRLKATVDGAVARIRKVSKGVRDFSAQVNERYRRVINAIDNIAAAPRDLVDAIAELYRLPGDLSQAATRDLRDSFAWAFNLREKFARTPFESVIVPASGAGLVLYGTGLISAAPSNAEAQRQAEDLAAAVDLLFETLAAAAWVECSARLELTNYDDALASRALLQRQVMRLLTLGGAEAASDLTPEGAWHDAVLALHAAGMADLQLRSRDLVRLTSYTPQGWESVWSISHRLFGTAVWADEILAMNPHIEHPLLVPPGRPLRIVRHD